MQKDSRIFVAGGAGMVGSSIIQKLIKKGYENILSSYYRRKPDFESFKKIKFYQIDFTKQSETENFFREFQPEYVFLAASRVGGIVANNTYKAEFIYENLAIATNIIHSSYQYGVKKLLNLGSSCIYPKFAPQPMKEEYLLTGYLEPTNEPYAIAKIAAIKLCRYYNEQYGTNFISVMPTNLYGPNDNFNLETSHVLPALIRKFHLAKLFEEQNYEEVIKDLKKYPIGFGLDEKLDLPKKEELLEILNKIGIIYEPPLEQKPLKVIVKLWGTGKVFREFLHVDDLTSACVYLMENVDANQMREVSPDYFVNIGYGEDILLKDLAYLVKEIVGFRGEIQFDPSKPDGTPKKLLDISKIKKLNWSPTINLKDGIKKEYDWYIKNQIQIRV